MAANQPVTCLTTKKLLPLLLSLCVAHASLAQEQSGCEAGDDCATELKAAVNKQKATPAKPSRKQRKAERKRVEQKQQEAINQSMDWYPLSQLDAMQLAITPSYCDGAYVQPGKASAREPTGGDLDLGKGDLMVRADHAAFDKNNEVLRAAGNIELRENGVLVRSKSAIIDAKDGTGSLDDATYVLHEAHARGEAGEIRRESENVVRLIDGSYTHCVPSSDSWVMSAADIELDQESGVGTAKHARLRLAGVPVFYWPYMTFPIDNRRRSGFLFPTVGTAKSSGGLDLSVPFYWNIAPNWDATIAPRFIEARGTAAEVEARHMNRYSNWTVSGSWIDDQEYGDDRWFYAVNEAGLLPGGWFHTINYTEVSDKDYLTDLSGATSLEFQRSTSLVQSANIVKTGDIYTFSAQAVQYQVLDDFVVEQYRRLPQLSLTVETEKTAFRPTWLLVAQGTQFDIDTSSRAIGTRIYLEPGVRFPMLSDWGFLTPTVKIKSVNYALSKDHDLRPGIAVVDEQPTALVPTASLDGGLYFERATSWFGDDYTNTLEPRLYYLYSKFEDQTDQPLFDTGFTTFDYNQLFRDSRFTGYDRIPDANQLSVGITSRLIQDRSGNETFWASIGQIYYFEDRKVTLDQANSTADTSDTSQLASEVGYQWNRNLRSYVSALYDHSDHEVDQSSATVRYFGDRGLIVNLSYNYRRQDPIMLDQELLENSIRQSDVSTIVPVSRHWALMGRYNYDHTNSRTLGEALGVEYNSCCWKVRVAYQSGLNSAFETERGLYFQIEMKGLGGTDTGVRSIMESSIVGFEDFEERDHF